MTITEPALSAAPSVSPTAVSHRPGSCQHELDLLEGSLMELGAVVLSIVQDLGPVLADSPPTPGADAPPVPDSNPSSMLASRLRSSTMNARGLAGDLEVLRRRLAIE